MEIRINCENPQILKEKIIQDSENDELRTWGIRNSKDNGKILTHLSDQYDEKALLVLTPDAENGILKGTLSKWVGSEELDIALKAIYISRFAQAVLTHYQQYFTDIRILK